MDFGLGYSSGSLSAQAGDGGKVLLDLLGVKVGNPFQNPPLVIAAHRESSRSWCDSHGFDGSDGRDLCACTVCGSQ